jgi:pilus assembly protein TadC
VLVGAVVGSACWRLLPSPATPGEREAEQRSAALRRQLPLAADLLAACLASWGAPAQAAAAVASALPEPMAGRLRLVAAELAVGTPPEGAWARLGEEPELAGLARCLLRADASGAPPASALVRLAETARRTAASAAQARVRRAGVLATAPLGLCFLPAFVLVGVVPVVTGLTGGFLSRF